MGWKRHTPTLATVAIAVAVLAGPALIGEAPAVAAAGAPSYRLNDVACVNASFCIAVGSSSLRSGNFEGSSRTVIERWNGTNWTLLSSPGGKGAALRGVTCRSTTFCIAVGLQASTAAGAGKTLAMRWNGSKWTILSTPNPSSSSHYAILNDVSCSSMTKCKAVGHSGNGDVAPTLAEHWNGTKWSIVASPNVGEGDASQWTGVACLSATVCMSVGQDGLDLTDRPQLESARWNGSKWAFVPTSNPGSAYGGFAGVSCLSPANCMAVGWSRSGSIFDPIPTKTVVEYWNGKKWALIPSAVGGTTNSQLYGITCKSATNCIAVGSYAVPGDSTDTQLTLVQRWNGTKWSKLASPNPLGAGGTALAAVACVSTTNCTAVGRSTTAALGAGPFTTLIEKWNGTSWSIVASPNPPPPTP